MWESTKILLANLVCLQWICERTMVIASASFEKTRLNFSFKNRKDDEFDRLSFSVSNIFFKGREMLE